MIRRTLILATILGLGGSAAAQTPLPALTPRFNDQGAPAETGFSTVEQRYVYAPPDEGQFTVPLQVGALPMELAIEEESMCEGSAEVTVRYSKKRNKVELEARFQGLPYRPSYCYETNPSTPFNEFPDCVEEGRWQIWLVGRMFNADIIFWYDALTLDLLGSEWDFQDGPPPGAFPVVIPGVHMLCSPYFDPAPNGTAHFKWEYDYDRILDMLGSAGVYAAIVPMNLCFPDAYISYWTNGGLPASEAMSFDDVLASIHMGNGMNFTTSLEPDPKPEYLRARDNIMIGHTGNYPQTIPDGYTFDFRGATVVPKETCETHQNPPWPSYYPDLCAVN